MAVEILPDESGQSILEFIFMLPVLIGLTILMIRVNTAIQVSIVNQQYSRAQATFLTFNSPVYPENWNVGGRRLRDNFFKGKGFNQMVIGVSDKAPENASAGGLFDPDATEVLIARSLKKAGGKGPAQEEPDERGVVRVRTTVTLCTQSINIDVGGQLKDAFALNGAKDGLGDLADAKAFAYCRGPFQ